MVAKKGLRWDKIAFNHFSEAIEYIKEDSVKNSQKVRKDILESVHVLLSDPKVHRPDKFKTDNDGSFRAFEIHHYRIAYRLGKNQVTIIRFRHTSMEPASY